MDISRLDLPDLVAYLVENSAEWIRSQQAHHLALADPLSDTTRQALKGFFSPETLQRARLRRIASIENPAFYMEFERVGQKIPLDFSIWAAITFGDVILVNDSLVPAPPPHSVVFHELVHVVQYGALGVGEFARRYVQPLALNRFQYMSIPLEVDAFDLQGRFERGERFNAEAAALASMGRDGPTIGRTGG